MARDRGELAGRRMIKVDIVRASIEHADAIAPRLRASDRRTFEASAQVLEASRSLKEAVRFNVFYSSIAWASLVGGRPEMMAGAGDLEPSIGAPWMIGTDLVDRRPELFLRYLRHFRDQLFERYSTLRSFIRAEDEASIRLVGWLGFTLSEPTLINGRLFRIAEARRCVV